MKRKQNVGIGIEQSVSKLWKLQLYILVCMA
jgi:hypothetical protein